MTYKAIDVANWFISQFDKESGDVITHLKVQKLLYFAEAWCQVLLNRELFSENMEAWAHGPVVRDVYNRFAGYGWDPVCITGDLISFDDEVEEVLQQVYVAYGNVPAKVLEEITHQDRPWRVARGNIAPEARCNTIIDKADIKRYFTEKYSDRLNGE